MASVLIIDDDLQLQQLIAVIAQLEGYDVSCADTVASATDRILEKEFDVCLIDVQLPDGYGLHLLDVLKNRSHKTKIIIISGNTDVLEDISKQHPELTVVAKPFHISALLPHI